MNNQRSIWKSWLPIAATLLVLGAAYSPLLSKFFHSLWNRSHYQHFPFVLAAFAFLLWQRFRQSTPAEKAPGKALGLLDGMLFAMAWVLLALAYYTHSPWLAAVSAIALVAGFLVRLKRVRNIRNVWGIWLFLWLILPLPTHPDQQLIAVLQRGSSRLSSLFLDWMGIAHLMTGNVLQLGEKQLFVDEACSGIVSLMSIVACAVIYSVWNNRSLLQLSLLTLAGVAWATLMNVTRISVIAYVFEIWGVDWSEGLLHELLGLAVFLLTFLALVSTDRLLHWGLSPIASSLFESYGRLPQYGKLLIGWWDSMLKLGASAPLEKLPSQAAPAELLALFLAQGRRMMFGIVPLLAFGMLGGIQYVYGDWLFDLEKKQTLISQNASVLDNASTIDAEVLPPQCATLRRIDFRHEERDSDDVFGKYSQIYEYQDPDKRTLLVSCDYPFSGEWHELAICYQGIGWEMTDRRVVQAAGARKQENWGYVEASFSGRDGSKAFLVYSQFDEYGNGVEPPTSSIFDYIRQRIMRPVGSVQGKQFFQVQVWTAGAGDVTEDQREVARKFLLDTRERFRNTIIKSSAEVP